TRRGFLHWRGGNGDGSEVGRWRAREMTGQDPHARRIRVVAISAHDRGLHRSQSGNQRDAESFGLI
ncbi:hypothetical protein, partial [Burkholderia ambifaria]|uniref:hypothetical protein n=1 Tax=Burkholderia ambifaria TaxID=152480 RepID=UPI001E40E94F